MDTGATTVIVATRPGDLALPSYLDAPSHDGVPVEAVTEDLGHGYGNGTPLLTLRDRLAFTRPSASWTLTSTTPTA